MIYRVFYFLFRPLVDHVIRLKLLNIADSIGEAAATAPRETERQQGIHDQAQRVSWQIRKEATYHEPRRR